MALIRHHRMICFDDADTRFQMRAAGIALRDGRVLLQHASIDDSWALPGGRIEQGESSGQTLLREMQEELLAAVEVGPLAFIVESFFANTGRSFHEVGFYHRMTVPDSFPCPDDDSICHRIHDGGVDVEFKWLPVEPAVLAAAPFVPIPLIPFIGASPATPIHIVDREVAA
jgi:8-oxo-dGTP pyrophosphatase MutT (NUDIX family)